MLFFIILYFSILRFLRCSPIHASPSFSHYNSNSKVYPFQRHPHARILPAMQSEGRKHNNFQNCKENVDKTKLIKKSRVNGKSHECIPHVYIYIHILYIYTYYIYIYIFIFIYDWGKSTVILINE